MINYAEEQQAIERRRALLDAMGKQAREQKIVGPTKYAIPQALSQLATAYFNMQGQKNLDQERRDNTAASHADLASELRNYVTTSEGRPGAPEIKPPPPGPLGSGTADLGQDFLPQQQTIPAKPPVAPNPREAVLQAMASQHPEMKAIGAAGFKEMLPQTKEINGQLVQYGYGRSPKVVGDYRSPVAINNQLVAPGSMGDFRDKYLPTSKLADGPNGPIFGQREATTGKEHYAPVGTNINLDMKGENAALKAGGEQVPKVLEAARNQVMTANEQMKSAQRIMALAKDPNIITGFAAAPVTGLLALGTKLGFNGPEAPAKTQALMAEQAKQTLANVKLLPGAITEKERPFLEMAAAGKIDWTPEAIQHLAGLSIAASHTSIVQATRQYNSAMNFPGAQSVAAMYPLPTWKYDMPDDQFTLDDVQGRADYKGTFNPAKPAAPGVISLDEYMKRHAPGGDNARR